MEPQILYEDKNIAVVNKPAGIAVHPVKSAEGGAQQFNRVNHDLHHTAETLIDWALMRWPEMKTVGDEPELRPGIVHRLDRDTSGVIVLAKNQAAFAYLKNLFQEHRIIKTYLALVVGEVKTKEGIIDAPIGRGQNDPTKRAVADKARGHLREAVTRYKVVKRFPGLTLLEVTPETGRTHQIRVHLASIKHPILGDRLYGGKFLSKCPPSLKRQFLHAASLELDLPSGIHKKFEAALPADLTVTLAELAS